MILFYFSAPCFLMQRYILSAFSSILEKLLFYSQADYFFGFYQKVRVSYNMRTQFPLKPSGFFFSFFFLFQSSCLLRAILISNVEEGVR